jgi:hypothetical protein
LVFKKGLELKEQARKGPKERDTHTNLIHSRHLSAFTTKLQTQKTLTKKKKKKNFLHSQVSTARRNWIANYYNNNKNKNTTSPYYNKKATDTLSSTPHYIYN